MSKYQIFYKENHNIILSEDDTPKIIKSKLRFLGENNILVLKKDAVLKDCEITFHKSNAIIFVGKGGFTAKISIFNDSVGYFGGSTFYNPDGRAYFKIAEHKDLFIGKNSLFSTNVSIETNDAHLLFEYDGEKYDRKNLSNSIIIEDHVWLGRNTSINKGSYITFNSVVAANSMINKPSLESGVILAGIPAKVIRRNIFWRGNETNWYQDSDTATWSTYEPTEEELLRVDYRLYADVIHHFSQEERIPECAAYKLTVLDRLYESKNPSVNENEDDADYLENLSYTCYFDKKFEAHEYKVDLSQFDGKNIHEIAHERIDENVLLLYKHLLANSYIFHRHEGTTSILTKRWAYVPKEMDEKNPNSLKKWGNIFYYTEYLGGRRTGAKDKKLLVVFSSFPSDDKKYDESMILRSGFPTFANIQRSLTKDTFVIRLVDLNLSSGSFYLNTGNYAGFEDDIQNLITKFAKSHDVPKDNIALFGASKGATGALIHSLLGGYKMVAVDPIIDDRIYPNDGHLQKSFRELDLMPRVNELFIKANDAKRYIINNHNINYTYKQYKRLEEKENLIFYDTADDVDNMHPIILRSAIPEVLAMLNVLLNNRLIL
jgi:acetyltransferase-like isoleucine patch superfamily enzyme